MLFVRYIWVVHSDVALTIRPGSEASLGHFNPYAAITLPFVPWYIFRILMLLLLATNLKSLQVLRLRNENAELFGDFLRVKLRMSQVKLFKYPHGALGLSKCSQDVQRRISSQFVTKQA